MDLPDEVTKKKLKGMEFELLEKEGGMDSDKRIFRVNPELFRKLKFLIKVAPDIALPVSDNIKKALNLEAYDRAILNPVANQENIFRKLLLESFDATRDNPDEFIVSGSLANQVTGQMPGRSGSTQKTINNIANKEARI